MRNQQHGTEIAVVELLDFKVFSHLAQTMHFGRTARSLGMSPSALTRRVQAMEDELGHRLFIRDHREVRMTTAGKKFRVYAQEQLDQWESLQTELREEATAPTGTLNLACTVTAAHTILPRLLGEYRKRYPGVTLGLITQDATRSLNQLEAGEVDLAVIPTDEDSDDNLARIVLGKTEFSLITSAAQATWDKLLARKIPDIAEVPLVAPIGGLERKRLNDFLRGKKIHPPIVAEVRGNEGIIAMVSLGAGIGIVPRLVLENSPLRGSVREIKGLKPPPGYEVSLCTRKRNLERRIVQLFWKLAEEGV